MFYFQVSCFAASENIFCFGKGNQSSNKHFLTVVEQNSTNAKTKKNNINFTLALVSLDKKMRLITPIQKALSNNLFLEICIKTMTGISLQCIWFENSLKITTYNSILQKYNTNYIEYETFEKRFLSDSWSHEFKFAFYMLNRMSSHWF